MSDGEMSLPVGFSCGDCAFFRKCSKLIGERVKPENTECDFYPVKFIVSLGLVRALRTQRKRMLDEIMALKAEIVRLSGNRKPQNNKDILSLVDGDWRFGWYSAQGDTYWMYNEDDGNLTRIDNCAKVFPSSWREIPTPSITR